MGFVYKSSLVNFFLSETINILRNLQEKNIVGGTPKNVTIGSWT